MPFSLTRLPAARLFLNSASRGAKRPREPVQIKSDPANKSRDDVISRSRDDVSGVLDDVTPRDDHCVISSGQTENQLHGVSNNGWHYHMKWFLLCFLVLPLFVTGLSFYFQNQLSRVVLLCKSTSLLFLLGAIFLFLNEKFLNSSVSFEILTVLPHQLKFMIGIDRLSGFMALLTALLFYFIQSYSLIYLRSDETLTRFLAQLNLLFFSILVLILSQNVFTAFVGWQFMGFSLYLLLNHYHYDAKANRAAKKKFIINRMGDMGFLLALILTLLIYQTDEFSRLFMLPDHVIHFGEIAVSARSLIGLSLLLPIMTKSAQFPFHIWLPDTLETPTPVSAIMHAGVINAGGFLLARLSPWFEGLHQFFYLLFFSGCVTLLLAGFLWQTQSDVKKQLAYSTMGQMGYMIMQCGLGLFKVALFHLAAHGFWKAYLFLSAGEGVKQRQKKLNHSDPKKCMFLRIGCSIFLVLLSMLGVSIFSSNDNLPPLIWYFIFLAVFVSSKYGKNSSSVSLLFFYSKMALMLLLYFLIYFFLDSYFDVVGNKQNTIPCQVQYGIILFFILMQCMLFKIQSQAFFSKAISKKIYLWSLYKYKIEMLWRSYLLNPFRSVGDAFNQGLALSRQGFDVSRIFILILLLLMYMSPVQKYFSIEVYLWFSIVSLVVFLICANRSPNLRTLTLDFCIITLSMANLSMALHLASLSIFHLVNVSLLCVALILLLMQKKQEDMKASIIHNRLNPSAFYVASIFFLNLGIPGTATFITEYSIFSKLFLIHPFAVVMLSFAMVILAVVILHTLQIYIFNPDTRQYFSKRISLKTHFFCLVAIATNLISGLFPTWMGL